MSVITNSHSIHKQFKNIYNQNTIKNVALPVVWNSVLGRHSCQTTDPCSARGLRVWAVCLSPQLTPGLGIQTGQERGLGGLCGCRTLSCGGDTQSKVIRHSHWSNKRWHQKSSWTHKASKTVWMSLHKIRHQASKYFWQHCNSQHKVCYIPWLSTLSSSLGGEYLGRLGPLLGRRFLFRTSLNLLENRGFCF